MTKTVKTVKTVKDHKHLRSWIILKLMNRLVLILVLARTPTLVKKLTTNQIAMQIQRTAVMNKYLKTGIVRT